MPKASVRYVPLRQDRQEWWLLPPKVPVEVETIGAGQAAPTPAEILVGIEYVLRDGAKHRDRAAFEAFIRRQALWDRFLDAWRDQEISAARDALARIEALGEEDPARYMYKSRLLRLYGRLREGVAPAVRATEIAPHCTEPWLELAKAYILMQDFQGLAGVARKVIELEKDNQLARNILRYLEQEGGQFKLGRMTAHGLFLGRAAGGPRATESTIRNLSREVQKAVIKSPLNAEARVNLARAHLNRGNDINAVENFDLALALGAAPEMVLPDLSGALGRLGLNERVQQLRASTKQAAPRAPAGK